jgi:hypothetical protein
MFNLYEILRNAQGGQAIDNLAAQFNITPEEADAAVKAVVPALSEGFLKQASHPVGLGSFIGALGEDQHLAAFTDPAAAQEPATAQKGGDNLSQVLGSENAHEEIALRASSATGISSDTLTQMLPVIASMIFGGLTKSLQNQGFGGIIGQLANAAGQGGLGPILGQILGGNPPPPPNNPRNSSAPSPAGGLGGLGSILGQILGGGQSPGGPSQSPAAGAGPGPAGGQGGLGGILGRILGNLAGRPGAGPTAGSSSPSGSPQVPGLDAPTIQAGLEALTKMLQPGTAPSAGPQQGGVQAEISDIMSGKRH